MSFINVFNTFINDMMIINYVCLCIWLITLVINQTVD